MKIMIPGKEKEEFTKFLKAMVMNSQLNYATNNMALLALLTNFTRETQIRAGPDKSERALKISEKIVDALPEGLGFEEIALIFGSTLLAQMMHTFNVEIDSIQKFIKEEENRKTGTMYA